MKVLIQVIRSLLVLVWLLLLAGNARLYVEETIQGSSPPQLAGWAFWTVEDGAMGPDYQKNDLLLIDTTAAAQPGDPVLYRGESGPAVSRIIGTSEGQLILKADSAQDSVLAGPEAVAGVCVTYLPGCGAAAGFLRSAPGLAAIVLAGLVLIVLPGAALRPEKKQRRTRDRMERVERQDRYTPRH